MTVAIKCARYGDVPTVSEPTPGLLEQRARLLAGTLVSPLPDVTPGAAVRRAAQVWD